MAEFALGLTKTAVEGTLSRVKLAIEEEAKLKEKVQQDLVFITGEFQMMQSFLKVANVKGAQNEVGTTWVRQVRDLAFEVEDCVEFVVHLDNKTAWGWLLRFGRMLVSCNAPPLPLDKAASDIRNIKAKVEDVSQRNTRYNFIIDSGSNSKPVSLPEQPARANTSPSAFRMLREVWEATGKCRGMGDLEELIKSGGSDLEVISIWGSTGPADLGVTSILIKAYNDPEICHGFKTRAWIKLKTPFNPDDFLKSLLTQVSASSSEADVGAEFRASMKAAVDMEDDRQKIKLMQQLMSGLKYFVILEDVSTVVEWDIIKLYLPDSKNSSRLVVSTKQLQIALLCTGKPYKVSELTRFSDDQSLCAFSMKSGRHSGKGEFTWQIGCRGVISLWGTGDLKSALVHKVYTSILYKSKQFHGVEFERHSWVDVPDPFNLEVFSRRLLLNFRSENLQVEEIAAVGMMRNPGLTEECCKFLRENDCFVVINGLQSTEDWEWIKATFLSQPIKGCIIVITNEESVAKRCVEDEHGALSIKDLEADPVLRSMIKGSQCYGIEDKEASGRGRFFSIRREEARELLEKLGHPWRNRSLLKHPVTSLWGSDSARNSEIVREVYCKEIIISEGSKAEHMDEEGFLIHHEKQKKFSWVDMQHPFNLVDFSRRLLLDFHSDDLQGKRSAAVGIMEGQDPTEMCCKFLREYKCLVVIDGLRSRDDWDKIDATFLSKPTKVHTIVITNDENVAKYVVCEEHQAFKAGDMEYTTVVPPLTKAGCVSHLLSNRCEEARVWMNTFELVGRQAKSAYDLGDFIWHYDGAISVWGIAGVGKSTLVRSVYYHAMLGWQQLFESPRSALFLCDYARGFTMYSWVNAPHPFNLTDFSRSLLLDFLSDDMQAKEAAAVGFVEGQDSIPGCRRILHKHKCFIVIDGLRSTHDWDLIKEAFLPDNTKSCIIVITNEKKVAKHCVQKEGQVVNIKGLDSGLHLFKKITWDGKELTADEKMLSERMVAKCGGILKVIVAIGEVIAKEITPSGDEPVDIFEEKSYFDACSDSVKPCIFYMSVFPAKHNIRRRRLLRRWMAEGYSRDTSDKIAEENGERLFSELVGLSIIQHLETNVMCQVNAFFHEYIISRPMEDNLVFALDGHCSLNSQYAGQHLTIRSSWDRDDVVFKGIDVSRLRSLTVFGNWKSSLISEKMRLVRVLDLEDALNVTNDDLEQIVKLLPRLKFLSLRGHKNISHLPVSLCGLIQLQTLDVRGTSVLTLPRGIMKLQKLTYIRAGTKKTSGEGDDIVVSLPGTDVVQTTTTLANNDNAARVQEALVGDDVRTSTTPWRRPRTLVSSWLPKFRKLRYDNGGVKVPAGIGNMTALHTLGVVNISVSGGKAILEVLKKLTQLRKLGVSGINRENWQEFCSVISGHGHLESLSVRVEEDKEGIFARFSDICEPPKTLKSLKAYGHVQISPVWVKQVQNIRKLDFGLTILTQRDIDELSFWIDVVPLHKYPFLEIDCTTRLELTFDLNLWVAVLKVQCSSGSSLRISRLENLNYLKEVWLKGSYSDELKQDLQRQIHEHPNRRKPLLKLEEPRSP
uniref:Disease resistance protein RPM1 n=1 Tax=Aegilops tauschii subsp. strangulata TaxID=200361 RepID=A0A453MPG0_AEGTS